ADADARYRSPPLPAAAVRHRVSQRRKHDLQLRESSVRKLYGRPLAILRARQWRVLPCPDHVRRFQVQWPLNGDEGETGADAFGIVVTLLVLCHIAEVTGDDRFVDRYHRLLDYASQRPESAEISAAID
ncbi:antirestriction protein, partial [Burkholderia contaminans]|uniref:antirestriction protein n=4 Tax=Burkholderia cepacia complex TaxID=87882 RepID=UPI003111D50C